MFFFSLSVNVFAAVDVVGISLVIVLVIVSGVDAFPFYRKYFRVKHTS